MPDKVSAYVTHSQNTSRSISSNQNVFLFLPEEQKNLMFSFFYLPIQLTDGRKNRTSPMPSFLYSLYNSFDIGAGCTPPGEWISNKKFKLYLIQNGSSHRPASLSTHLSIGRWRNGVFPSLHSKYTSLTGLNRRYSAIPADYYARFLYTICAGSVPPACRPGIWNSKGNIIDDDYSSTGCSKRRAGQAKR